MESANRGDNGATARIRPERRARPGDRGVLAKRLRGRVGRRAVPRRWASSRRASMPPSRTRRACSGKALDRYVEQHAGYWDEALEAPTARGMVEQLVRAASIFSPRRTIRRDACSCAARRRAARRRTASGRNWRRAAPRARPRLRERLERAAAEGELPPDLDPARIRPLPHDGAGGHVRPRRRRRGPRGVAAGRRDGPAGMAGGTDNGPASEFALPLRRRGAGFDRLDPSRLTALGEGCRISDSAFLWRSRSN